MCQTAYWMQFVVGGRTFQLVLTFPAEFYAVSQNQMLTRIAEHSPSFGWCAALVLLLAATVLSARRSNRPWRRRDARVAMADDAGICR